MVGSFVSQVVERFKAAVAKWQVDIEHPLECRFLLRDGYYVGHHVQWGAFHGIWVSEPGELKIYRDREWLLTMPMSWDETPHTGVLNPAPSLPLSAKGSRAA